jgi:hypothetical protein
MFIILMATNKKNKKEETLTKITTQVHKMNEEPSIKNIIESFAKDYKKVAEDKNNKKLASEIKELQTKIDILVNEMFENRQNKEYNHEISKQVLEKLESRKTELNAQLATINTLFTTLWSEKQFANFFK